ncbi:MAG: NAD-dependent DNA ligase LigA [Clostridia bacterium]
MTTVNNVQKIKELTAKLNEYREAYYNSDAPLVSDKTYDQLYDDLLALETDTGFILANSPTQTVGYSVLSNLEKTNHQIPLLSLDKTKNIDELIQFSNGKKMLLMPKFDGLTVKLTYENGKLVQAATRGNGDIGEDITHNAKVFNGIPLYIPYKEKLVITGEAFILDLDFEELQKNLVDSNGNSYRNSRNLASGSVRLLDSSVCKGRKISFMPFNVLDGFDEIKNIKNSKTAKLAKLQILGFNISSFYNLCPINEAKIFLDELISELKTYSNKAGIPIDGMVITFDDIEYSKAQGRTGHHYKDGLAFKFEDELFETTLKEIEWKPSRTGEITPVAVFNSVEIDGCEVQRASLHNLTFIKELELMPNSRILVSKRNMIIPHVEENLDKGKFNQDLLIPKTCPCCGEEIHVYSNGKDRSRLIETIFCDNDDCAMRKLRKLGHFVSKKAMNIEGLSEVTLEKFVERGFIKTVLDIYCLDNHKEELVLMDGFGDKSYQRLWNSIEKSKETTFERYIIAMDIPMIGNSATKTLKKAFNSDLDEFKNAATGNYDFTELEDFGETLNCNIHNWFKDTDNQNLWEELQKLMNFRKEEEIIMTNSNSIFAGKTIVVTGKVEPYTRESINGYITSLGATPGKSVTKNTDYLVCGAKAGSKLEKAKSLGVTILTPTEFLEKSETLPY